VQWAGLVLLASLGMASTASALSLANFQPITSSGVSLGCILAYNAQLPGCTAFDFTHPNRCSPECVAGVNRVQGILGTVCGSVDIGASTLLGQALVGSLLGVLCPAAAGGGGGDEEPPSSAAQPSTTATLGQFTTIRRPTSTPPPTPSSFSSAEPSSTSTSSSSGGREIGSSGPAAAPTPSPSPPTPAPPAPSEPAQPPPPPPAQQPSSAPEAAEPEPEQDRIGTGSPFDPLEAESGGSMLRLGPMPVLSLAVGLGLLLLR